MQRPAAPPAADDEVGIYGKVLPEDSITDMCKAVCHERGGHWPDAGADRRGERGPGSEISFRRTAGLLLRTGGSLVIAMEAWARFITAAPQFQCIEDSHMQAMAAALSTPDDVILFFSYSGATKDMLDVLRPARRRGAKIILVTHFAKSPAAAMADVTLLCGSKEGPLQSGSVAVKMGLLFIIDVLFNEYCRTNPALTEANREATAGAISAKLL
ncbi:MAG: SIS domain-containing protein [Ruthenibacterium lactatiformans]